MKKFIGMAALASIAAFAACHSETQSTPATPSSGTMPNNGNAGAGSGATDELGNPTGTANVNGTGGGMSTADHKQGGNRTSDGGH